MKQMLTENELEAIDEAAEEMYPRGTPLYLEQRAAFLVGAGQERIKAKKLLVNVTEAMDEMGLGKFKNAYGKLTKAIKEYNHD